MSTVPSIFDTPAVGSAKKHALSPAHTGPNKKKKNLKEKLNESGSQEFTDKSPKKENISALETVSAKPVKDKKNTQSSKAKAKKKVAGLKIKLQETKRHKQIVQKRLELLNNSINTKKSKNGKHTKVASDDQMETSLAQENGHKKSKSKNKQKENGNQSHIDTPSKVVVKTEPASPKGKKSSTNQPQHLDSANIGKETLAWVINPIPVDQFMDQYWEQKPLLIQRKESKDYYKNLLSREAIDDMLRAHNIEYTKNIDVTSYREGKRETHNPEGRVLPPDMWAFYEEGCSIRMLNPQTYLHGVYEMNVKLQEFFHCMTGANFYLTPPNSQGFAPHYDDIEAFVLQVEGRKHWKVYNPRDKTEELARLSSPNFDQNEIGTPIMEVTLRPGDMLYFPRGFIHQASTVPGHHSLHVTMSVYQKNCWADLLEVFFPHALALAADTNVDLRCGVPMDIQQHFGIVYSDNETPARKELVKKIKGLVDKVFSEEAIDYAVDQLAKRFQHDALPPLISDGERPRTVYGENYSHNADGTTTLSTEFTEETRIGLLRRNVLRLVNEEDKLRVYYHNDNSREYHQFEPNFLEVDHDAAVGIELLVKVYPEAVTIGELPVEDKVDFARSLWEKGLVVIH